MKTQEIKDRFLKLIESIDDPILLQYLYAVVLDELNFPDRAEDELSEDELDKVFEPKTRYGQGERFVIELPEEWKKGILEGLEDFRAGRVLTDEEAEAELNRFFENKEWENEKD